MENNYWVTNVVYMFRDVGVFLISLNFLWNKSSVNNIGVDDEVSLEEPNSETRVTHLLFCDLL